MTLATRFVLPLLLAGLPATAQAPVPMKPLPALSMSFALLGTRDGGVAVGGYGPKGPVLVRLEGGRERWKMEFDWAAGQIVQYPVRGLAEIPDGALTLAATGPGLHPSETGLMVVRLDRNGKKQWERKWALKDDSVTAQGIQALPDGHSLALGLAPNRGLVLVELDGEGKILRERLLPKEQPSVLPDLDNFIGPWAGAWQAPDGGVFLAWNEEVKRPGAEPGREGRLARLDRDWKVVWQIRLGAELGRQVLLSGLAPHPEGGVLLTGEAQITPLEERDTPVGLAIRVDGAGKRLWQRHFGHGPDLGLNPRALLPDGAGGFLLVGYATDFRQDPRHLAWSARLDSAGQVSGERLFRANQGLYFYGVAPVARGGLLLAGSTHRQQRQTGILFQLPAGAKGKDEIPVPALKQR